MTVADSVDLSVFAGLPCYVFKELIELLDSVGHYEHAFALLQATDAPYNRAMANRLKRLAMARPFKACVFHLPKVFYAKLVDIDIENKFAILEVSLTGIRMRICLSEWDTISGNLEREARFPRGTQVHTRPVTGYPRIHDLFAVNQTAVDLHTGEWGYEYTGTQLTDMPDWSIVINSYWVRETQIELSPPNCRSCQVSRRQAVLDERLQYLARLANGPPLPRVLDPDVARTEKKITARAQKVRNIHRHRALRPLPQKVPLNRVRIGQRRNR